MGLQRKWVLIGGGRDLEVRTLYTVSKNAGYTRRLLLGHDLLPGTGSRATLMRQTSLWYFIISHDASELRFFEKR